MHTVNNLSQLNNLVINNKNKLIMLYFGAVW